MDEVDFKFGKNIYEPLNKYFTHYIADIIDTMVSLGVVRENKDYHDKCLNDKNFFVKEMSDLALTYIERDNSYITKKTFEILFNDKDYDELINLAMTAYKTLYDLKYGMINYNNKE